MPHVQIQRNNQVIIFTCTLREMSSNEMTEYQLSWKRIRKFSRSFVSWNVLADCSVWFSIYKVFFAKTTFEKKVSGLIFICTEYTSFIELRRVWSWYPVTSPPSRLTTSELATKERSHHQRTCHQAKSSHHQPPIKRLVEENRMFGC